jgi:hypothetical protein
MTQYRAVTTSDDGSHPAALPRDETVANRVDATVDQVQAPSLEPAVN